MVLIAAGENNKHRQIFTAEKTENNLGQNVNSLQKLTATKDVGDTNNCIIVMISTCILYLNMGIYLTFFHLVLNSIYFKVSCQHAIYFEVVGT